MAENSNTYTPILKNFIFAGSSGSGGGATIVTDGLVAFYDAGNPLSYSGSGTTWTDLSGSGYDGTLNGGVTYNNGSFEFDGVDDHCLIDPSFNSFGSQMANGFTFSCWVRTTTVDYKQLYGTVDEGQGQLIVFVGTNINSQSGPTAEAVGDTIFYIRTPFDQFNVVYISEDIYDGEWHNLVWCYDGLNTHTVYVDGSQVPVTYNPADPENNENTTGWNDFDYPFAIGAVGRATVGQHCNADISVFQAYNKVLSSTEVQQNFEAFRPRYGI